MSTLWSHCLRHLEHSLPPQQFSSWIRPLQAHEHPERKILQLLAPNSFIFDWVLDKLWDQVQDAFTRAQSETKTQWALTIDVGQFSTALAEPEAPIVPAALEKPKQKIAQSDNKNGINSGLNPQFTFEGFVEGKANQMANAAAHQFASNLNTSSYNPLFIYGGVGLGKTHLMHAIGNHIVTNNPNAKVVYLSSERFVQDMVTAIRHQKIEEFKNFYRSLDALLIDDIQFFADKTGTQEEFFHTFNTLLEGNKKIVLTSDKFPKEIKGLEDRLKSRFGWGLTIAVEPPEFEMRIAILQKKAKIRQIILPNEVAFFIAKRVRANVRELEGALNRVFALTQITNRSITIDVVKEALRDSFAAQQRMVTLDNIQKTIADFYKLKISELISEKRTRNFSRPRQIAMFISKELTTHSLPEIAAVYQRDHTTVLHACRQVEKLRLENQQVNEDVTNLLRILRI